MSKSFELKFDTLGNVVISNIKGVEGTQCLDLTNPYIEELEDKSNPAVTIMDEYILYNTEYINEEA